MCIKHVISGRYFIRVAGMLSMPFLWLVYVIIYTFMAGTIVSYASDNEPLRNLDIEPIIDNEEFYYSENVILRVSHFEQAVKLFHWLDLIKLTKIGQSTLEAIASSQNQLIIYHNDNALYSAGMTGAPLTKNLINGVGEDVYIKFYLEMEHQGSNCVLGENGYYIEYSAIQNLFHELSHARHKMNGSWLYFDSEGQAIREENNFRYQWAQFRVENYFQRNEDIEEEDVLLRNVGLQCF